jgi:hypothetical protein
MASSKYIRTAMKGLTALLLLTIGCLVMSLLSGCGKENVATDTEPPAQVSFTPRSAETDSVESGIDAVPEGNYIYLSWLPSYAADLAGYRLYRQAEDSVDRVMIAEGIQTIEYIDRDAALAPNSQTGFSMGFFYWVTAYDESGNESALSQSAYYRLMDKPGLSTPVPQSNSVILSWSYNHLDPLVTSGFIVRLFRFSGSNLIPIFIENHQEFFPLTTICPFGLSPGNYRYQVDVVGATPTDQPSGSEAAIDFSL